MDKLDCFVIFTLYVCMNVYPVKFLIFFVEKTHRCELKEICKNGLFLRNSCFSLFIINLIETHSQR